MEWKFLKEETLEGRAVFRTLGIGKANSCTKTVRGCPFLYSFPEKFYGIYH